MGARRPQLRDGRLMVLAGRRSLHGLHLHRRSRPGLRCRRARFLRGTLRDRRVSRRAHRAPRFWTVARREGYVTSADFVRDRYGNRALEIAVALTGVVAALPYIALQLVGMRAVFSQVGALGAGHALPALTIAFVLLAAFTYTSGLRAPAMIAFVKDTLIYVTVIAAIVVIPAQLGGWAHVFAARSGAGAPGPSLFDLPCAAAIFRIRDDGVRLCALAFHLSALDHQRARGTQPRSDPAQCGVAAALFAAARAARAAWLLRRCAPGSDEGHQQRGAAALRALFSGLVRRRRVRRRSSSARSFRPRSCASAPRIFLQATCFASSRRCGRRWRRSSRRT